MSMDKGIDDRTPEQKSSALLMGEIYDRRARGESWEDIHTWLVGVKEIQ